MDIDIYLKFIVYINTNITQKIDIYDKDEEKMNKLLTSIFNIDIVNMKILQRFIIDK